MFLAIDIGNTNTVFALIGSDGIVEQWRCATDGGRTEDEYFVWLSALMSSAGLNRPLGGIIISSVMPRAQFNINQMCMRRFSITPLIVGETSCRLPVAARIDPGTQVGADRLVNAAAAFHLYGGDLVVVDFGTATTFDVVDHDGAYIGGAIAPGIELSLKALHEGAAALPHVGVVRPDKSIGKNTLECMHSGVYWGYLGLIEGICSRIGSEFGRSMKVIGTGGLAGLYAQGSDLFDDVNPDLTILGLSLIAGHNGIRCK